MDTTTLVRVLTTHVRENSINRELTGTEIALLLQSIAEHEIDEGGPYGIQIENNTQLDAGLTLLIACFLKKYDVYLPNVDALLKDIEFYSSLILSEAELNQLLALYNNSSCAEKSILNSEAMSHGELPMMELIEAHAQKRFSKLPLPVQELAHRAIRRTIRKNTDHQMSLMAYYVREAIGNGKSIVFSDESIADMGLANIFFWTAFIIYDDFWDEDEQADPQLLPIANIFARHSVDYFTHQFPEETEFREFFTQLMDTLDSANAWETRECRMYVEGDNITVPISIPEYGNYEYKYSPASGHILGPVVMLVQAGFTIDSVEVQQLISYFRNYLIAMQLNDDLQDWKEDLSRGHISTAVAKILEEWKVRYPESCVINLDSDKQELESIFWFTVLTPMCNEVLIYAGRSRAALKELKFLQHPEFLEQFIIRNEKAAQEALAKCEWSKEFIQACS